MLILNISLNYIFTKHLKLFQTKNSSNEKWEAKTN